MTGGWDWKARPASPDLGNYNRATTEVLLAVLQRIDDVNRNVNGVAMRLDGKPGPYNLKMR